MNHEQDNRPLVSILCLAFNHQKYLAEALDSFLMQETDFSFEIVIHDDASTDGTTDIIRAYSAQHPDIIRPIYQTENQYSKGDGRIVNKFMIPHARGKYLAFCEGDDYWTDPLKLQLQIDYMENNPDCVMCTHASSTIDREGKTTNRLRPLTDDADIKPEHVIMMPNDFSTATLVLRSAIMSDLPPFYYDAPSGDSSLKLYCVAIGKIHYIDRFMSVYRVNAESSWTERVKNNPQRFQQFRLKTIQLLAAFDAFSEGKFADIVEERIKKIAFHLFSSQTADCKLTLNERLSVLKRLSFKDKWAVYFADKNHLVAKWIRRWTQQYIVIDDNYSVRKLKKIKRRIHVWGGGGYFESVYKEMQKEGIQVHKIVDNNSAKWGTHIQQIEVVSPATISQEHDYIVIASSYFDQIERQLQSMGFERFKDYNIVYNSVTK